MCLLNSDPQNRRYRALYVISSLCLAVALGSQSLNITFGLSANLVHFLRGVLLGFYIAFMFGTALAARRNRLRTR
jgi:NO-binding membrane sensor protein with MHYT domain